MHHTQFGLPASHGEGSHRGVTCPLVPACLSPICWAYKHCVSCHCILCRRHKIRRQRRSLYEGLSAADPIRASALQQG